MERASSKGVPFEDRVLLRSTASPLLPLFRECVGKKPNQLTNQPQAYSVHQAAPSPTNYQMPIRFSHLAAARRALQRRSALRGGTQYSLTLTRWHVGHHRDQTPDQESASPSADRIFRLGLASDVALALGKTVTGYVSGSTAIIADAAHFVSNIVLEWEKDCQVVLSVNKMDLRRHIRSQFNGQTDEVKKKDSYQLVASLALGLSHH